MDLVPPLAAVQACSVQPLDEDLEGPRAPLLRQVSLDEERRDECQGHWRGTFIQGEEEERGVRLFRAMLLQHLRLESLRPPPCVVAAAEPDPRGWWMYWRDWHSSRSVLTGVSELQQQRQGEEEERGVRLFRAMLLQHLRLESLRPPPCVVAAAEPDPRGWWMYWRDWRSLERAARRFRETRARGRLAARAAQISLLSLDEVAFEDIMQELCQACAACASEQRALVILAFLCEVCSRAVRVGGWCRAAGWAARHVAYCATPWAIRHGGWSAVIEKAAGSTRREEGTFIAGAALAALFAFLIFCRTRIRHSVLN